MEIQRKREQNSFYQDIHKDDIEEEASFAEDKAVDKTDLEPTHFVTMEEAVKQKNK